MTPRDKFRSTLLKRKIDTIFHSINNPTLSIVVYYTSKGLDVLFLLQKH